MDNCRLILDGREIEDFIPVINFVCWKYAKGSIIEINNKKYRLTEDLEIAAEQIED